MQTWKFFRSAAAMLLAGAMMTGAVSANWEVDPEISVFKSFQNNLPQLIKAAGVNSDNCYLSNYYPIYDSQGNKTGRTIAFIFNGDRIVADMVFAANSEGKIDCSVGLQDNIIISEAFENKTPVCFYCCDDSFMMANEDENFEIISNTEEETTISTETALSTEECCTVAESEFPKSTIVPVTKINLDEMVDNVALQSTHISAINYDTGAPMVGQGSNGTCWAACVASKVSYTIVSYMNNHRTADDVYNLVIDKYGAIGKGRTRYKRGLSVYGLKMSSLSGIQSFDVLKEKTQDEQQLVIMRLKKDVSSNDEVHAVLLKGYQINNPIESSVYLLMDPNYSYHRAVYISNDVYNGTKGFTYVSSIGSYTWFDSLC